MLATNHVFDILVRAMGSDGDLQKIEHETLPPRKRAGWTGGDDRCRETSNTTPETAKDGAGEGTDSGNANADNGVAGGASSIETDGTKDTRRVDDGEGSSGDVAVVVGRTGESETGVEANTVAIVAVAGDGEGTGEDVKRGGAQSSACSGVPQEGGVERQGEGAVESVRPDTCKEGENLQAPEGGESVEKAAIKRIAVCEGKGIEPKRVKS